MSVKHPEFGPPVATVDRLKEFQAGDLEDLCDATEAAIRDGGGFGWVTPPPRDTLEAFWRGALLIRERVLFVGRLDGVIAGSCQLTQPTRNNEAQAFACTLTTNFVAPWARGHGLSRRLIEIAEAECKARGFRVLNLDVRETQGAAIRLYESLDYVRFGTHPHYAVVGGRFVAGHFYYKLLHPAPASTGISAGISGETSGETSGGTSGDPVSGD